MTDTERKLVRSLAQVCVSVLAEWESRSLWGLPLDIHKEAQKKQDEIKQLKQEILDLLTEWKP